jgi:hypothetical protein
LEEFGVYEMASAKQDCRIYCTGIVRLWLLGQVQLLWGVSKMLRLQTFVPVLAVSIVACGAPSAMDSGVNHSWGETTRGTPPEGRSAQCPTFDATHPDIARLNSLAEKITNANPETFRGKLQLSQLCIGINAAWNHLDARTQPEVKTILFSNPMVLVAQNDDELAAVLSHELAHITLQHQGFGEAPPRVAADPIFSDLKIRGQALQTEVAALAKQGGREQDIFRLSEQYGLLQRQMNERIDAVYGEANAHANWFEQEADEVGGEFFVRAGFKTNSYLSMLWRTSSASTEDYQRCQGLIENALLKNSPVRPERGGKVHPTTCWRAFHLKVDEWSHAHATEIGRLGSR